MPEHNEKLIDQVKVLAIGSLIGLVGRGITWPHEYAMYVSADKMNKKSLFTIYAELFNSKKIYELNCS